MTMRKKHPEKTRRKRHKGSGVFIVPVYSKKLGGEAPFYHDVFPSRLHGTGHYAKDNSAWLPILRRAKLRA